MEKINREDMMELTRRMTVKRNCFSRMAGAYLDEEGYVDGTFNIHFLKLSQAEQAKNLAIAKTVPFAETNVNLKEHCFTEEEKKPGGIWQLLRGIKACGLKNDELMDLFYEVVGEKYHTGEPYAIYVFYGSYDVPLKANDKEQLWESEEVYQFLLCTIGPVFGDYEPGKPEYGFLFPAFKDRSGDENYMNVFHADAVHPHRELWG